MSFTHSFGLELTSFVMLAFYLLQGTVDSGHLCLSGYNEVVMLRRLPERHKCRALELLNGSSHSSYSALYGLPHRDDLVSILFDLFTVYMMIFVCSYLIVLLFFRTLLSVGRQKKQLENAKIWGRLCLDPSS